MAHPETLETWQKRWEDGRLGFHKSNIHEMLQEYISHLTGSKKRCRIFVPLCGKSVDLTWLWKLGHEVVGVEAIDIAVQDFFTEQKMEYSATPLDSIPGGKRYQNVDGSITIYKCDMFALNRNILGSFDAIWDRGSIVAIDPSDQIRYSILVKSLLAQGGRILVESYLYDKAEYLWNHAPFTLSEKELQQLYGSKAKTTLLNTRSVLYDEFIKAGLTWMHAIMVLISFDV